MTQLPKELYFEIFSHLPKRHLQPVSRTCRAFAALTKPLRFEELHFHGDAQGHQSYLENDQHVVYPGRTRTVEMTSLEAAVDDVIVSGIATYVKRFVFAPKHYVAGFWRKYHQWVEDEVEPDGEQDFHRMGDNESDHESDDEFGYVGLRRIAERRHARPEKERKLIEAAEKTWVGKVEEQSVKAEANAAALIRMFESMPNLRAVEIVHWCCSLSEYGLEDHCDPEIFEQFSSCTTTWAHLNMLSSAIRASNIRIAHLTLPGIDPLSITINAFSESLFRSLTTLSFNVDDVDFMLQGASQRVPNLIKLISCTSQTLQDLEFGNHTMTHPQYPSIGEKFLNKLFVETSQTPMAETPTLVFPNLKTFKLRGIILDTPSFLYFLSSQPALQYARFLHVYLATIGCTWADVARAMPRSCTSFYVEQCGHELWEPTSPVASNHIKPYYPYKEAFGLEVGWQANEAIFEQEKEDQAQRGVIHASQMYSGRSKEEWMKDLKMRAQYAVIERVRTPTD